MSRTPLKSESRKNIIKIEINGKTYYFKSFDDYYHYVHLVRDPEKARKIVKDLTIDDIIKNINSKFTIIVNRFTNIKENNNFYFRCERENIKAIPAKFKENNLKRLKELENNSYWDERLEKINFKKAFEEKDFKILRKIRGSLNYLFNSESEMRKLQNLNLDDYLTFSISVVDARNEVRAEKLRRLSNDG